MATGTRTIRWLHLSDFHVGKDDYATRKMFDYILDHVKKRKQEGLIPDLLFFTGDLANKGLRHEYEMFWEDFALPLQEAIGSGIAQRTFAIPGNHDVDRTKHPAISREDIAREDSHYLDPTEEGARLRGDMLVPRFANYLDHDCTSAAGGLASPDGAFVHRLTIHGHEIGIVGINTAWLSKDDKDERQLTPGKPLLEKALNAIGDAKLRMVLGHHPIDWLRVDQQKAIKSLLGQHQVLYLHGHLHGAWAEPTYGGGQSYLAIQSGAGFQAREGEKWRNGLLWGEADLDEGEICLQPWHWNSGQQAWTPDTDAFHEHHRQGDWWHYQLPCTQPAKTNYAPKVQEIQPPKGWAVYKSDALTQHCVPLETDAALRFFDGAVPDWSIALSSSIPRRQIVGRLVESFQHAENANRPIVTLLLAAGCEGKTTALLQAAHAFVMDRQDWRILQRRDESQPLVEKDILPMLDKGYRWLLLLDESDRIATELLALLKHLPHELHGRVHALLACRDSDWRSSGADALDWRSSVELHKESLIGLEHEDAKSIVQAWQSYGEAGLGDLGRIPDDQRAQTLEMQAKEEAKTKSGAFFGALLAVRNGPDLHKHAVLLLERLGRREIRSGGTLRDALAYIAVMHAEGLEFLSRPVLARALGCPLARLHRDVLVPLGQEAAATTTSSVIFTRHRRIADALVSILEQEYGEDVGQLFIQLGEAAITAFNNGDHVPQLSDWRFEVSGHFFKKGQQELAFNVAQAVLACEPANPLTRTHVANLYRKAKLPDQAVRVFRESPIQTQSERGLYHEWAVAEGEYGNHVANAMLESYSLSDQCPAALVDNDRAKKGLAGLGVAFGALYDAYNNPAFRDARMAVAILGLTLRLDAMSEGYFQKHAQESVSQGAPQPDLQQAFKLLRGGVIAAAVSSVVDIPTRIANADELTFDGLHQLVRHSSKARR